MQSPVHAYAGPGLGLGAIVIFITVIISIIASVLITLKDFIIRIFRNLKQKNNPKSKKLLKHNRQK